MKHGMHRVFFHTSRKYYDFEGYVLEYVFDGYTMRVTNVMVVI